MAVVEITLDVSKPQECVEKIEGRQGDTGTVVRATILEDGEPYDFGGRYAELALIRPDGWWVHLRNCVQQVDESNVWECELPVEATAYDGVCKLAYFVVRDEEDDGYRDSTQRFLVELDESVTAEAHLGPYSDQVDKLIMQAELIVDAWQAQMEQQEDEFNAAQQERAEEFAEAEQERAQTFETNEAARQSTFTTNETAREATFTTNETARQQTFSTDIANWQQQVTTVVGEAEDAIQDIEDAISSGELGELVDTAIEAQKDVEGGIVSYDTYLVGIQNAGTPDEASITKTDDNKLAVKDGGITAGKLADGAVTTGKLADDAVTADKLADGSVGTSAMAPGVIPDGGTGVIVSEGLISLDYPTDDELLAYLGLS